MSHYKEGDKCSLIDRHALKDVSMKDHVNKHCTLIRKLSCDEIGSRSALCRYEETWWVDVEGVSTMCYVPVRCLLLLPNQGQKPKPSDDAYAAYETEAIEKAKQCGCWYGDCKELKKEQNNMYLHTVTIIRVPSTMAQQAGEIEEMIVPPTPVMAKDTHSAIAKVAAMNSDVVLKASEKSSLRIIVPAGQ